MLKRINKYIKTEEDEESEKSPSNIMQDVNEKMLKMKLKREKQKPVFHEFCTLCSKTLSNLTSYNNHINSNKHKMKFKSEIIDELKRAGSFKNFFISKGFINQRKSSLNKARYYLYLNSLRNIINN